ncbi:MULTISPECIES: hypothetical protein [unclassified Bosea (in: a-proteobacteria)]|nr:MULTISPECIES: hypothetical protein [unclassified Bosea (in: a-proteobacteria)]
MANTLGLDRIALADASAVEARAILQQALAQPSVDVFKKVASTMRAWAWKALTSRRSDSELADWHDLLRRLATRANDVDQKLAARFEMLAELIHESIASAEISDPKFVLQRSHTRKMLTLLAEAPDKRLERSELGTQLGLQQANLTRVINMLVDAGLVIKSMDGKRVVVEITRAGEHEAARLTPSHSPLSVDDFLSVQRIIQEEISRQFAHGYLPFHDPHSLPLPNVRPADPPTPAGAIIGLRIATDRHVFVVKASSYPNKLTYVDCLAKAFPDQPNNPALAHSMLPSPAFLAFKHQADDA